MYFALWKMPGCDIKKETVPYEHHAYWGNVGHRECEQSVWQPHVGHEVLGKPEKQTRLLFLSLPLRLPFPGNPDKHLQRKRERDEGRIKDNLELVSHHQEGVVMHCPHL